MDQDNLYDKIQDLLGNLQGNFNILEEQIDIDLQLEYFETSKNVKKIFDKNETLNNMESLFSDKLSIDEKKTLLIQLASIDKVEAYRSIEKYKLCADPDLKDWATLAMQESKMLLESIFLDQNQIFISTGLGGKGKKLRYFIVFLAKQNLEFGEIQRKILKNEIEYIFKNKGADIEDMSFSSVYCTIKAVIPLEVHINDLFEKTILECNQMGEFLDSNFIVTNVKELTYSEILGVLNNINLPEKNNDVLD